MNRRTFVTGGLSALALSGCVSSGTGRTAAKRTDDNLSVLISDLHVGRANPRYAYTLARLEKTVGDILAMDPLPANVVCFGDIAQSYGLDDDYAASRPALRRLVDAGIRLTLTLGNHDRRGAFLKYWPEYARTTQVPGRVVSVVDLGTADLVLLDALKGADDRAVDDMGPVEGTIDPAQLRWLESFVAQAKRPFFVGSHQFRDLSIDAPSPIKRISKSPFAVGWIYGHDHEWSESLHVASWAPPVILPALALPSASLWGDIGYVTLRTNAQGAVAALHQDDFYFKTPTDVSPRPHAWDVRVKAHQGRTAVFSYLQNN